MSGCCSDVNTGLAIRVSVVQPNVPFTVAIGDESSNQIDITIDVGLTGARYLMMLWLTDGSTPVSPEDATPTPPSGDDTTVWYKVTDALGQINMTIENTSGANTWYLQGVMIAPVGVSSAIAFV